MLSITKDTYKIVEKYAHSKKLICKHLKCTISEFNETLEASEELSKVYNDAKEAITEEYINTIKDKIIKNIKKSTKKTKKYRFNDEGERHQSSEIVEDVLLDPKIVALVLESILAGSSDTSSLKDKLKIIIN